MNELGLPSALSAACSDNWKRVERSGREIDQEFVRRGFVGVQAEIDFMQRVFGPASYGAFLEVQSSPEAFERFRAYDSQVRERLELARSSSSSDPEETWAAILNDQNLPSHSKTTFLKVLSSARYEALLMPHIPPLLAAQKEEQANVCKLYSEPATPLYDKSTVTLRKEVCNSVMADAYGALGFKMLKRKKGVDVFTKVLSSKYAVIIEPDGILLDKPCPWRRSSPAVYWPLVQYDQFCYLGSPNKQGREQYFTFSPIMNCVAASRLSRYDDTRSLETVIRANALWYELTIAPFERSVTEMG